MYLIEEKREKNEYDHKLLLQAKFSHHIFKHPLFIDITNLKI